MAGGYDVSDSIGNLFNPVMQNRPLVGRERLARGGMRSGAQNPFTPPPEVWAVCVK